MVRLYKRRRAINYQCIECGRPAEPGRLRCREHLDKNKKGVIARQEKLRKQHRCIFCGKLLNSDVDYKTYCLGCNTLKHRNYRRILLNGAS